MLKTIWIPIDAELLERVEQAAQEIGVTRSAFIRDAVLLALRQRHIRILEAQHVSDYEQHPPDPEDVAVWDAIRVWNDT